MKLLRVFFSTLLLIILVTVAIEVFQQKEGVGDAAKHVLYSIGVFGALMVMLDYFECRRR